MLEERQIIFLFSFIKLYYQIIVIWRSSPRICSYETQGEVLWSCVKQLAFSRFYGIFQFLKLSISLWLLILNKFSFRISECTSPCTFTCNIYAFVSFSVGSAVKNLPANVGDTGPTPASGRCPGEGNDNPLQYSCLWNPLDRGAWWATVYGVTKSWTPLSN